MISPKREGERRMDLTDRAIRIEPLLEAFSSIVRSNPDAIAIADGSHSFTRRELYDAAIRLAEKLVSLARHGTPVGLYLANDATFAIGALACVAAGVPHVALDVYYPETRNAEIARRAGIGVVIERPDRPSNFVREMRDVTRIALDDDALAVAVAPAAELAPPPRPLGLDEPFVLLFTSGSTGVPKGVAHSQRSFLQSVYPDIDVLGLTEDDRSLGIWSPSTIAGLRAALSALLSGARSIVRDPRSGLAGLVATIRDERITICRTVPALVRAMAHVDGAREAMRYLRVVQLGGERVYGTDIDLLRPLLSEECKISIGFGSTEAGIVAQWFVSGEIRGVVPCGFAAGATKLELIDSDGKLAAESAAGELRSTGAATALGFWNAGVIDAAAFATSASDEHVRSHATGDLFRYDDAGRLVHAGRVDRMLKINGQRVDLGDVEAAVRRYPGVREAAVVSRENGEAPHLIAFVVTDDADSAIDPLRAALRAELPAHMVPAEIRRLDEIPHLPGFKPDFAALDRLAAHPGAPPETSVTGTRIGEDRISRAVVRAWSETLDAKSARRNARWDEAGGDSMRMLLLAFRIERVLDRRVSFTLLGPEMRPSDLIARLRDGSHAAHPETARATLVLCAGREGDDPRLVRFRRGFETTLATFVPAYLPWHTANGIATFDAIVDDVVAQIVRTVPGRPLLLAGYSFGGFVAHEAARRLVLRGEAVAFVGLLDANLAWSDEAPKPQGARGRIAHAVSSVRRDGLFRTLAIRTGYRLAWTIHKRPRLLAFFARPRGRALVPGEARFFFDYKMMRYVRDRMVKKWQPNAVDFPVTLFRARTSAANVEPDNGWRSSTPHLSIENVDGSHLSMIEGEHGERLARVLSDLALRSHAATPHDDVPFASDGS